MTRQDAAFWLAVALVSVVASVAVKLIAARTPWTGFQEFAAAS